MNGGGSPEKEIQPILGRDLLPRKKTRSDCDAGTCPQSCPQHLATDLVSFQSAQISLTTANLARSLVCPIIDVNYFSGLVHIYGNVTKVLNLADSRRFNRVSPQI